MALGEKAFEESGNVVGFKVTKVHPIEGTTMEVSFAYVTLRAPSQDSQVAKMLWLCGTMTHNIYPHIHMAQ
ncbi:hypothetical protein Ngar_c16740 [Candidatus Nitrososphaera gargensis Ga9.2]|uniref:Uncharacterized protein n=1 Tax=Nitrososphaera gargensis (strain Ga9.2) TaxID=1237085 RepID=K0IJZ9_NITGG|nr:hypothetical protein [Candidatus Nitrososphaera gargensis]AFU58607.1 hypothetical protein Ngar_c16740 [Candidatus Nitrososphaera gargensis Ga9.2]